MRLMYENYTVSYKSFPGAPIKFQEIFSISRSSRSCRHWSWSNDPLLRYGHLRLSTTAGRQSNSGSQYSLY